MLFYTFIGSLTAFLTIYVLRGFGLLSFLPGSIVLLLLFIALSSGITWGVIKTFKY
jgi:hypothetical protein